MTKKKIYPRTFKLLRLKDVSGVSGKGIVAEGVEFHDYLGWASIIL